MTRNPLDKLESQVLRTSSSTSRVPPGAIPLTPELEETFELIMSDIAQSDSFHETIDNMYGYAEKNQFITSGQWDVLRSALERRGHHYRIKEIEQTRNEEGD